MRSKNLGMRPSGTTSLAGHVDSPRQNELSSSRGLHTPYITMYKRSYGEKSFRGRGRGAPRGRRPAPYHRHEREDSDLTIPKSAPDHMLAGGSTT